MNNYYRKYLNSDHWKSFRDHVQQTRGYQCEDCGVGGGNLHVHHLTYENLWDEQDEDVLLLCKDCHNKRHPEKLRHKCTHENTKKCSWESGGTVTFGLWCKECQSLINTREPETGKEIKYLERVTKQHLAWLEKQKVKDIKNAEKEEKNTARLRKERSQKAAKTRAKNRKKNSDVKPKFSYSTRAKVK